MKVIDFGPLSFTINEENVIAFTGCYENDYSDVKIKPGVLPICEFDIAGGNTSGRNYMRGSYETANLRYVEHEIADNTLKIIQRSDIAEVTSQYTKFDDTNAVRVTQTVKNISSEEMCLEMANSLGLHFGKKADCEQKDWYFHKFTNARYVEAMPDVRSLYDMGMFWRNYVIHTENIGNNSSYENLPQGIVENRKTNDFIMFQIESYYDWFYEITIANNRFNLQVGGPTALRHAWNKILKPNESYTTVPVAMAFGKSLNGVIAQITKYRRHIKPNCEADKHLPTIFNEYMHLSWDSPFAKRVYDIAPSVQKTGCEYYVIDCGWHNPIHMNAYLDIYKNFGTWYESLERFPDGIKAISDYVHSLGMKFGLWIAPEVVGTKNTKMLEYYDDECFFMRNGKKIAHDTGYVLDFRHPKVYDYMSRSIDRMIDEYGCDYIKFDGCPNPGFGTEINSTSLGDGLEKQSEAFLKWVEDAMQRHPNVIFEDCAGGGQRIDYKALSMFQLVSTSDQTKYNIFPYISSNILASVLPEQAAVWCYPVDSDLCDFSTKETTNRDVSAERVVINMINAFLGRLHLASRIHLLNDEKISLIREAIDLYEKIVPEKLKAVPYLPLGYSKYGDTFVSAGLKTVDKLYLAVWNLNGERHIKLPLAEITVKDAKVIYPTTLDTKYSFDENSITIDFTEDEQARFFEISL